MKVKKIFILIALIILMSCSKRLKDINYGLYTSENRGGYLTELNLLKNNTFFTYYELECIATPQMNVGTFHETSDSITFTKDKDNFLNYNIKYEYEENSAFLIIEPYILVDFISRSERSTNGTELSISTLKDGEIIHLVTQQISFPQNTKIKIDKQKLLNAKKLIIRDEMINHTFEIKYEKNLRKILTPTGLLIMHCYEENTDVEKIGVDKFKNKIYLKYSDEYKVKYKLNNQ
jgi:hypothetical protein